MGKASIFNEEEYLKRIKRIEIANKRHTKLQRIISEWFKKQGYKTLWEWYSIDVVAYKLEGDSVKELIGMEVKTWIKNSSSQIKKAIFQATKFKRYVDKFYLVFRKTTDKENNKIPEWIGIINVGSEPFILREAKCQIIELPFYAVNWWKEKLLLKKFKIPKAYKLTTRAEMEEKLQAVIDKNSLTKALRMVMLEKTPSLEEIKNFIKRPILDVGQKSLKDF